MLRDEELHAAVVAAPDDDAPRLVYADWLSEHGDPRGEFIALEIALAKLPRGDERRAELEARRHALWWQHAGEWLAPFSPASPSFHRGFVEEIHDAMGNPLQLGPDALRDACLRRLVLQERESLPALDGLLQHTRLPELRVNMQLEPDELAELLGRPSLAHLQALILDGVGKHAGHVRAIAATLPALRSLVVAGQSYASAAGDTFAAILAWPATSLRTLHLEHSPIGPGVLTAAALAAPPLAALESLRLTGAGLDERDVAAICASALPLVELDLSYNALGPAAARTIADTPRFEKLVKLGLADTKIGKPGLDALIASPHLSTTCQLALDGELLDLTADVWIDGPVVTGASWRGTPPAEVTRRFALVVQGSPTWETCQKYL